MCSGGPPTPLHTCRRCLGPALQRMVMRHVGPDTILVGHALDNDLRALKV
jgi:hypothetical protein